MPHYVVLYRFTDEGAKNARETVRRARESTADNQLRADGSAGRGALNP